MTFEQRFSQDLKESQLKKQELRVSVLRLALASMNNKETEKRTKLAKSVSLEDLEKSSKLTEEEMIEVMIAEAKKRQESITSFEKGQRPELAQKEREELAILEEYLPQEISEPRLREMAKEAIAQANASSLSDLGKAMAALMPEIKKQGRADNALASRIIRELLTPKE